MRARRTQTIDSSDKGFLWKLSSGQSELFTPVFNREFSAEFHIQSSPKLTRKKERETKQERVQLACVSHFLLSIYLSLLKGLYLQQYNVRIIINKSCQFFF